MSLVTNFTANTFLPNEISLSWLAPIGFNNTNDEIIITKDISHFPVELFNASFPNTATDITSIEIFRGSTITGTGTTGITQTTITTPADHNGSLNVVYFYIDLPDDTANYYVWYNVNGGASNPNIAGRIGKEVVLSLNATANQVAYATYLALNAISGWTLSDPSIPTPTNSITITNTYGGNIEDIAFVPYGFTITMGTLSDSGNIFTDTSANFPTSPPLTGRLFRDNISQVFTILSNTNNTLTLSGIPEVGEYVILADFPTTSIIQENYISDIRTTAAAGSISNLVVVSNGTPNLRSFKDDEVVNLVFRDAVGQNYIIKSNDSNTLYFFNTVATPVIGTGMFIFPSFNNSITAPYIDNFKTAEEAAVRIGTGLLDDQFYYYTAFVIPIGVNVAQADYATVDSAASTQASALSIRNSDFGDIIFNNFWPTIFRSLDQTNDLQTLMDVFGHEFNFLHSLINTFSLQNTATVYVNALQPLSEQMGLPTIGYSIGIDTMRRIANDMLTAWKLKGSKEGIALFIRIITTWDITGGTGDYSSSIQDFLPNTEGLRFFSPSLGITNTRLTETSPVFVPGGRFVKSLPGIIIPGFFTFREFVVNLPNVAMYIGQSQSFVTGNNSTTMIDTNNNFGTSNSLVGNYLLPHQQEVNDIFLITANTATSITVEGNITDRSIGDKYVVLSPLNANRFSILNKLIPLYEPYGTMISYNFE